MSQGHSTWVSHIHVVAAAWLHTFSTSCCPQRHLCLSFSIPASEQGKSARVKGNRIPASFFFHHEQIASCSEQVSNQSPVRNRRGLSSCEADVSVRWDYSYMLSSRRNGCLPNLRCNTERLFLVLQSPEIAGLVSTATDRQIHSKWQQFLVFTLFCLCPQCLYRQIHGSEDSLTLLGEGCG